jgi:hypothetical protein
LSDPFSYPQSHQELFPPGKNVFLFLGSFFDLSDFFFGMPGVEDCIFVFVCYDNPDDHRDCALFFEFEASLFLIGFVIVHTIASA